MHCDIFLIPYYHFKISILPSTMNSNSQKQPTASYKQTSKLLLGACPPTSMKTTRQTQYMQYFKYPNTVPTVPCTSNNLICGYIAGVHFCLYNLQSINSLPRCTRTMITELYCHQYFYYDQYLSLSEYASVWYPLYMYTFPHCLFEKK